MFRVVSFCITFYRWRRNDSECWRLRRLKLDLLMSLKRNHSCLRNCHQSRQVRITFNPRGIRIPSSHASSFISCPSFSAPFNVELNSEKRAEERQEYERRKRELEAQNKVLEEEINKRRQEEERLELIRLRQETVMKSGPIKSYKPINIKPSNKALTEPFSPRFHKK